MFENNRYVQIDDWIFEVKMVRAIKVSQYGKPYSSIANCNIQGDSVYIDGLINKNDDDFSRLDFMAFKQFFQQLGLKQATFDRFKNGQLSLTTVDLSHTKSKKQSVAVPLRLVSTR